jgi:hypothetical protein
VVLIDKFTLLSEECSDAPESRRNKEFINRKKKRKEERRRRRRRRIHSAVSLRCSYVLFTSMVETSHYPSYPILDIPSITFRG